MDSGTPMMLPKGIVVNTASIYDEVASYTTVPAHKIWEYWHVYTTTNKKLQDPTARRLENFWWHVLGSDRRLLSGRTLARIYKDISVGSTIAPLQGPPNRWEGPNAPLVTRQLVLAHLGQERVAQQNRNLAPPTAKPPKPAVERSSSSTTPKPAAPPPSILKKSKTTPSPGPRPTARFVSPHGSADEADKGVGHPRSSSASTTRAEMPSASSRKKPPPPSKKFTVASAAARRRPLLARKTSPQSTMSRVSGNASGNPSGSSSANPSGNSLGNPRPVSPISERSSNLGSQDSQEADQANARPPGLSAKALGKRPALPPRAMSDKGGPSNRRTLRSRSLAPPEIFFSRSYSYLGQDDDDSSRHVSELSAGLALLRPYRPPSPEPPPAMERSRSHDAYAYHSKGRTTSSGFTHRLVTGATASTTNVAAQGTIIDQAGSLPVSSVLGSRNEPLFSPPPSASSVLESRLTPTQPGSSASVPMGRTRSQLTLLLEREKARTGDKPRPKG